MKIQELGHIVLRVRSLENSVHFYRDVLGFREVAHLGTTGVMFAGGLGRTHHELLLQQASPDAAQLPEGRALGLSHFALKIGTTDEELRLALDEVKEAGVQVDHVTDHGMTHSVYLRDPDGNHVEIYIDVQPELWRDDPSTVGGHSQPLTV